ncbi:single-strand binding protein [Litorimonas taeanensis]|uniref:Single-stranded DNA-binding protein n=1 Tax=Litorimonas taeanensis TaxID=568099 RepID=A0A420WD99_9PROT|nr:single-stranded DNA-binding protein [Litorimonas taeanensis]RKQ68981.1 single-strand binding protein [Litorimonas taeanensis]
MAASVNKVILIGHVGKDPEIRSFSNGGKVANFSIATSEHWKNKQGERQEKTEWHNIAVFNDGLVGVVERYIKKGAKLYIEGKLQTRKWTDRDGNDKYTTEVVLQGYSGIIKMLDSRSGNDGSSRQASRTQSADTKAETDFDLDDDIPF